MISGTFGFESNDHYFDASSCHHSIKDIKTPTLFMHARNDPIIPNDALHEDKFASNPNTILGITEMGGHTSYHESIFDSTS